jgi:hypothetical protein
MCRQDTPIFAKPSLRDYLIPPTRSSWDGTVTSMPPAPKLEGRRRQLRGNPADRWAAWTTAPRNCVVSGRQDKRQSYCALLALVCVDCQTVLT